MTNIQNKTSQLITGVNEVHVQLLYHGMRADMKPRDLIEPVYTSNYGDGPGRIYIVEPTGPIMDDPNLTKSYRSAQPLRVTGEVKDWQGNPPEVIQTMKNHIKGLKPIDN